VYYLKEDINSANRWIW